MQDYLGVMNWKKVRLKQETVDVIKRGLIVYLSWVGADFFFLFTRGEWRTYQVSNIWPVTLCYIWIVLHNVLIFKKLLFERRLYLWYIIVFVPSATLFSYIYNWLIPSIQFQRGLSYMTAYSVFLAFVGAAFFLAGHYYNEKKNAYKLLALQRDVELKQLKTQLNPHFLFNSLNNIYSYNLENNSHGNDLILKLSDLMRFMVETSNKDTILLSDELNFIDNYITFERERLGHRCEIVLNKNIRREILEVPPLILFPLIENAFKHGTDSIRRNSKVDITIESSLSELKLIVRNSVFSNQVPSTKTGIPNIQKRLELLFPNQHELKLSNEEGIFTASLKIDLENMQESA